jgi:hypothetical protein
MVDGLCEGSNRTSLNIYKDHYCFSNMFSMGNIVTEVMTPLGEDGVQTLLYLVPISSGKNRAHCFRLLTH